MRTTTVIAAKTMPLLAAGIGLVWLPLAAQAAETALASEDRAGHHLVGAARHAPGR